MAIALEPSIIYFYTIKNEYGQGLNLKPFMR